MPPKFKRHLNDDDVTGSVKSERRNLLEDDSDEEEDFFLRGPSGPRFGPRNDKIKHVQNQVDEVIDVMQENITKVIERGERLDELQDKSESLSDNATAFSNRSKQLRRQMWWRGCKIKAIMALVAVILLLVIIILIVVKYRTWFDDRSSLNKIWDNNNKRLLHNLNETHVYNIHSFFFKKLWGKYHFKLEHWECPIIFLPSNKMLLLIIMFEAKITSLDFAIFQGSNLKLDTCQFTIVYIVKHW